MDTVVLWLLLACGENGVDTAASALDTTDTALEPDDGCSDAPAVSWESWGEGFFTTWCQACHSQSTPQRSGAPEGVDFDTEADVVLWSASIRRTVLEDATMPVGGGVSESDATLLSVLLDCGLNTP